MTDTKVAKPPLPVGGNVIAIVPQNLDEIFRVAEGVLVAGFAPQSLVAGKTPAQAKSSIAMAIMAGAELGMPPMASLRSFTVIGGRPALYGDGLINVIRRSGRAKLLKTGFEPGKKEEFGDDAYGWCRTERADTNEVTETRFSVGDAKRAGLWDEREKVKRKGKNGDYEAQNDAPWHRYPKRMLAWRAAGYCLREVYGDVLGGLMDDQEAREIAVSEGVYEGELVIEGKVASMPPSAPEEPSADSVLDELDLKLKEAFTVDQVEEVFDALDVQVKLAGNDDALSSAFDMKSKRLAEVTVATDEDDNNGD